MEEFGPYAVVRTANRQFSVVKRSPHMPNPAPTIANPNKYNHLLQQGSKAGLRIGGLGKTAGVRRRRRYKFGKQDGRRLTGKGGFIVKNAKTGYLHRIAGDLADTTSTDVRWKANRQQLWQNSKRCSGQFWSVTKTNTVSHD